MGTLLRHGNEETKAVLSARDREAARALQASLSPSRTPALKPPASKRAPFAKETLLVTREKSSSRA